MSLTKSIYTQEYKHLVSQLRKARNEASLTQKEVAAKLGVTQSLVSKMEAGQYRIDVIQLQQLAKLYGREVSDFVRSG